MSTHKDAQWSECLVWATRLYWFPVRSSSSSSSALLPPPGQPSQHVPGLESNPELIYLDLNDFSAEWNTSFWCFFFLPADVWTLAFLCFCRVSSPLLAQHSWTECYFWVECALYSPGYHRNHYICNSCDGGMRAIFVTSQHLTNTDTHTHTNNSSEC